MLFQRGDRTLNHNKSQLGGLTNKFSLQKMALVLKLNRVLRKRHKQVPGEKIKWLRKLFSLMPGVQLLKLPLLMKYQQEVGEVNNLLRLPMLMQVAVVGDQNQLKIQKQQVKVQLGVLVEVAKLQVIIHLQTRQMLMQVSLLQSSVAVWDIKFLKRKQSDPSLNQQAISLTLGLLPIQKMESPKVSVILSFHQMRKLKKL